jgi:hypothetical protein
VQRLKALLIGAIGAALAITALGAPVVAVDPGQGRVTIVQGIPGRVVDVCIGGREVKSGLRYGKVVVRTLEAGPKWIKVFRKDPRRCKGTRLISEGFALGDGDDLTIVLMRAYPYVLAWDNAGLGTAVTDASAVAMRHGASLGKATFKIRQVTPELPIPPTPAADPTPADPVWKKGYQAVDYPVTAGQTLRVRVTRPGKSKTLAGPKERTLRVERRHEWILVGTSKRNARLVAFSVPWLGT